MSTMDGGGASRTTEAAAGTSAATDVSLHSHLLGVIQAERVLTNSQISGVAEMAKALRTSDMAAVAVAFEANKALTTAHNDLLRRMELQGEQFATREAVRRQIDTVGEQIENGQSNDDKRFKRLESWQSKLTGGMIVLGFIGISNLIKIWT